jgi:nitrate reductase NapAB chaperone NapD
MTLADNIDWVVVIQSGVKMELPKNRPGFKGLLVCKSDVRVVGNDELVLLAGSHVQGVVANEVLDIMNVPGVSAIVLVFGNRFE